MSVIVPGGLFLGYYESDPRAPRNAVDPLEGEVSCHVLDHEANGVIVAITDAKLHTINLRAQSSVPNQPTGTSIRLDDQSIIAEVSGLARYRNISTHAQNSLAEVITKIILENPEPYLSFYNRAGNLSLKMHAFAILPGIGNKKALEMVDLRGRDGWDDFAKLDADCGINAAELLADRLAKEIADKHLEPRLVELLLRREE